MVMLIAAILLQVIQTITPYIEREDFDPAAIKKVAVGWLRWFHPYDS